MTAAAITVLVILAAPYSAVGQEKSRAPGGYESTSGFEFPGRLDAAMDPDPILTRWSPGSSVPAQPVDSRTPGIGRTVLASLILPGAGQWMREERRGYLYMAAEIASWIGFAQARREGDRNRIRYRDLAWNEARLYREGDRVVDDFRYYEAMANYASSGAWDRDPTEPGIQPETDPTTFNGRIWELARGLFFSSSDGEPDPTELERALAYYRDRGFETELLWEWEPGGPEMEEYRALLEESDEAFRRSTVLIGVIAANHLLSAVDAFVSSRLGAEVRSTLHRTLVSGSRKRWFPSPRPGWSLQISVTGAR